MLRYFTPLNAEILHIKVKETLTKQTKRPCLLEMRPVHYLAFVKFALECYKFLDCRNITIQIKEKKIKKQLFLIFCTCVQLRN